MKYDELANKEIVQKTIESLKPRNVEAILLENGNEALTKIKEIIPNGASVMNESSVTLEQIGFIDYLKQKDHGWKNLHELIVEEKDPAKQKNLRKEALSSDYYLGSVHALCSTGEFVIASNSGSQLPHIVYTSPNVILVVSTKKIVDNLEEAMKRLNEYVIPLEDKHMHEKYGVGTANNKTLIFHRENPNSGRKIKIILVNEILGF